MTKSLSESLEESLPEIVEGTGDAGSIVIAISVAFATQNDPRMVVAALGSSVAVLYMNRIIRKAARFLTERLRKRNLQSLLDVQKEALVPMMYKYLEAAREGEYDRNLRILASYLTGELELEVPDPASFSRMVRRVEGLSETDLKVIAMIDAAKSDIVARKLDPEHGYVTAAVLQTSEHNRHGLSLADLQESMIDLAARGFLRADAVPRYNKEEEWYFSTRNFLNLMNRARDEIEAD